MVYQKLLRYTQDVKKNYSIVIAGSFAVVLIVTTWHINRQVPTEVGKTQATTRVKPESVKITLPDASPIDPLPDDYKSPSSLWVIVNKALPLSQSNYRPDGLVKPPVATNQQKSIDEQSVRSDVVTPISDLFAAARSAGFDLMLASGFRSYELQQTYFTNYARLYGESEANMFSARPGQSEHQTGLSFDVSLASRVCYLEICFGDTPAGKWVAEHAHEYGFILRYPSNKTEITQYQYEPWHFRYVGKDLAAALHTSELTLEEAAPYIERAQMEIRNRNESTAP